jgi:uncharacterized protein YjaG (DUF416 family)
MPNQELKSIDNYEVFLTERMTLWSPQQRMALAAAIAERWLPAYESFSAEEEWGDPASLRRSLEAVWGHVQGRMLAETDLVRHIEQIKEITPHMDDFDAEEALTACAVLTDALRSCGGPESTIPYAVRSALGVFEGLVPEWPIDPASQPCVWQKSAVRKELQAQLKLIEEIDAVSTFNAETIKALRSRIAGLRVKAPARSKPKGPPALTNQMAFEQYRWMVESDLKGQVKRQPEPTEGSYLFALAYFGYWLARYSRRLQTIDGSYGRLADEPGQRALVARNRSRDTAEKGLPEWDKRVRDALETCLKTNSQLKVLDADGVETPHAYGPSLRRLWLEGRRLGQSDEDAWQHVRAWASHRPTAWEGEDRRKKKGLVHSAPELGQKLAQELSWRSTNDRAHPWATEVDGTPWRIRVNDFPDELMYTLIIGSENAGDFHDWPEAWQRASDASPGADGAE